jgi:hypothetical protein
MSASYVLRLHEADESDEAVYIPERPRGERFDTPRIEPVEGPVKTEWLWPNRLPLRRVTVIEGPPGSGKSSVAFDLAARVARGAPFPDGAPNRWPRAEVLAITRHKDDPARFAANFRLAGDAQSPLFHFSGFSTDIPSTDQYGRRAVVFPFDMEALEYHLEIHTSIGVVIIDPLSDFCATPALLAETLHQLNELAERHCLAVIVTIPANCRIGREGKLRASSRWSTDAARWVWCLVADPDDPERMLLVAKRSNFCVVPDGLAFRLEENGVAWEADSKISPADPVGQLTECDVCVRELLSAGTLPARAIFRLGADLGFARRDLRAAAKRLGVNSTRIGFGGDGHWEWTLTAQPAIDAAALARDLLARSVPAVAEPLLRDERPAVEIPGTEPRVEMESVELERSAEQPFEQPPAPPGPAVETMLAVTQGSGDGADTERPIEQLSDSPAAEHPTAIEPVVHAVAALDERGYGSLGREADIGALDPEHVRPLSKRKAKKARRKLARQRAADLRQARADLTSATDDPMAAAASGDERNREIHEKHERGE